MRKKSFALINISFIVSICINKPVRHGILLVVTDFAFMQNIMAIMEHHSTPGRHYVKESKELVNTDLSPVKNL